MFKEKIKVYLYTRVSTTMQIDGYSLEAQKNKMKAFCDYKWNGGFLLKAKPPMRKAKQSLCKINI